MNRTEFLRNAIMNLENKLQQSNAETARLREQLKVAVGALDHIRYEQKMVEMTTVSNAYLIADKALAQIKDLEK